MFFPRKKHGSGRCPRWCAPTLRRVATIRDARDLRRFQLASRLAALARQYGHCRPDWLRAWAEGQATLDGSPLAATEQWQPDLWARLTEHVQAQSDRDVNWILPIRFFRLLLETTDSSRRPRFTCLVSRISGTASAR